MLTVTAQLEQMVALLQLELSSGNNNAETRILDTILSDSDNILAQVVGWSKCLAPGHVTPVLTLSLSLCEVLVSCRQAGQSVLSHSRIVTPLLSLLDTVHSLNGAQPASPGLQTALLGLVHSLCVLLTEAPSLLSPFTSDPGSQHALAHDAPSELWQPVGGATAITEHHSTEQKRRHQPSPHSTPSRQAPRAPGRQAPWSAGRRR